MAARSLVKTRAGPVWRYAPSAPMSAAGRWPCSSRSRRRARGCRGCRTPCSSGHARGARAGGRMTSSGSTPSRSDKQRAHARAPLRGRPPVEHVARAARRSPSARDSSSSPERTQVQHDFRNRPGEEHANGRMRPVGQRVHETRDAAIDVEPVGDRRTCADRPHGPRPARAAAGSWIHRRPHATTIALRTAAAVTMSRVARPEAPLPGDSAVRSARAMSSQTGWPEGASALCGTAIPSASATTWDVAAVPEELAAAARRGTGAASERGRLFERHLPVREPCAERLHGPGVLAIVGRQRHTTRAR